MRRLAATITGRRLWGRGSVASPAVATLATAADDDFVGIAEIESAFEAVAAAKVFPALAEASGGITYPDPMGRQTIGTPDALAEKVAEISAARAQVSGAIYEKLIPQKFKQAGEAVVVELPLMRLEQQEGDTGRAVQADQNMVADAVTNKPLTTHHNPFASADTVFQRFLRPQLAKAYLFQVVLKPELRTQRRVFYPNGPYWAARPENGGWTREMEAFHAENMILKGLRELEEGQHLNAEGQRNANASTSAYDVKLKEALYDKVVAAYLSSDYLEPENMQAFNEFYFGFEQGFPVEQDPNQASKWFRAPARWKPDPHYQVRFGNLEANDILVDQIGQIEIVKEPLKNKYYAQYWLKFRPKVLLSYFSESDALNYDVDAAEILIKHPLKYPETGMIPEEAENGNAQLKPIQARWKVAEHRTDGNGEKVEHGIERVASQFQKEQPRKEVVSNGTTSREEVLQFPKWDTSIEAQYREVHPPNERGNPGGSQIITRSILVHKSGNMQVYPVSLAEPLKADSAADSLGHVTLNSRGSLRGLSALDRVAAGRKCSLRKGVYEFPLCISAKNIDAACKGFPQGEPVGCSLEKLVSMEILWGSLEY